MADKSKQHNEDQSIDTILRPESWSDYVGQEKVKRNLHIIIEAAKKRNEPIDHLLFYGQPGLGKTTLARLVTREMGASIKVTSGPTIERAGDLAAILSNLEENEILFVDEAHRLNRMIEEILYPAMESRKLHIVIGKGPGARSVTLDLPPFTLIAATTRVNLLSAPLRARFGATFKLDYYEEKDIEEIIKRSAKILGVGIDTEAIEILAKASRFTPRTANRLLKRARDYIEVHNEKKVTGDIARKTLEFLEIDELGLENYDRAFLKAIIDKFDGGPVGINTIAAALNEDRGVVEDVYEPYLMRIGFLRRTPGGRVVERAAIEHLGGVAKARLL
ncbi:MAG: Holliday junction DNA helicase RuvB [Candidatus Colwellbacteria bacterium RIFCSPHIGHO2_02_FULL_45_17]|nr:MAG: Holliday junction DNA helicase RuvB [Candidatus Colwellbacteria bacterium RIFCSPHIGHO2_02_FULL_45_17]